MEEVTTRRSFELLAPKGCIPSRSGLAPQSKEDAWRMPRWVRLKILDYDNGHLRSNDLLFGNKEADEQTIAKEIQTAAAEKHWNAVADAAIQRLAEKL
jgi:hypothetical protein